ncbi:MAG: hypothetical protein ACI8XC_004479 [Gammaproteobacteria bacterium]|jgi:hypothetical protein
MAVHKDVLHRVRIQVQVLMAASASNIKLMQALTFKINFKQIKISLYKLIIIYYCYVITFPKWCIMKPFNTIAIVFSGVLAALLYLPVHANEPLDAHEHGSASLDIAIDGNVLVIRFESPAVNIVGFEYSPDNDEKKRLITQAKRNLSNFDESFRLHGKLSCQVSKSFVTWHSEHEEKEAHTEHAEHAEGHDDDQKSEHAEFLAEFEVQCDKVENLTAVEVKLFELFPAIEEIDAQVIFSGGQLKQELNANSTLIRLSN